MYRNRHHLLPLLLFAWLLFGVATLHAQESAALSGYVVDAETQETLIGAVVTVRGTKLGGVTNKSGFFSIKNIPAGKQTISFFYIGYERDSVQLDFAAG